MTKSEIIMLIISVCVSTIVGLGEWRLKKSIDKSESAREKTDAARRENEVLLVKSCGAAIALGEASALALKNGRSNGETEAALAYAREVKHEHKNFFVKQGIDALY